MTRTLRITYSLSFLGLLVGMGAWSTGGLQSFQRTEQMTLLNGKLAKAAETHYDAEFPIKRLGTNVWAAMDFKLFNEGAQVWYWAATSGCSATKSSSPPPVPSN